MKKPRDPRFFTFSTENPSALYHCSHAARAQSFTDLLAILENGDLLQIGLEFPIGSAHRETAIMTESCRFSTRFTLRHDTILS
jgi:hypothetical protein